MPRICSISNISAKARSVKETKLAEEFDEIPRGGPGTLDRGLLAPAGLERDLGYKLRLAQILAWRAFEDSVEGHGAAPRYLGLLALIDGNPGQPQSRLAEAIALKRSSLVPILDRLEAEGLVERHVTSGDKRTRGVWLTERGRRTVRNLRALAAEAEAAATRGLDPEARRALLDGLDRIIANLS